MSDNKEISLSTFNELHTTPCGTSMASCCGQITKVIKTEFKISLLCSCLEGEKFVVTAFKKGMPKKFETDCVEGFVVAFTMLRAQRFNKERFNGQQYFGTPFEFEFIYSNNSKHIRFEKAIKKVDSIGRMQPGFQYEIKCIVTKPFVAFDSTKLCTVIADEHGNRADLYVSGTDLVNKLGTTNTSQMLLLKKCFVTINGAFLISTWQ
uniref:Uncharacterized protein n=1 Tax=Meloidogyne hapla TaxID=6305 RepID=A0A1I8B6Y3_MELHA